MLHVKHGPSQVVQRWTGSRYHGLIITLHYNERNPLPFSTQSCMPCACRIPNGGVYEQRSFMGWSEHAFEVSMGSVTTGEVPVGVRLGWPSSLLLEHMPHRMRKSLSVQSIKRRSSAQNGVEEGVVMEPASLSSLTTGSRDSRRLLDLSTEINRIDDELRRPMARHAV